MGELSLFDVIKSGRRFAVTGDLYIFRARSREPWVTFHATRHEAELEASKMTAATVEQALDENARFDRARAYLAQRRARVVRPAPQLSLF